MIQDTELGEITWKSVDKYYKNMSSQDTVERREANQWLIKFYASEHSDKIASELLEFGDQPNQLLAISIIDAKVNKDWDRQGGKALLIFNILLHEILYFYSKFSWDLTRIL